MKLDISDAKRQILVDMYALSTDDEGNEILVGLTFEESKWYQQFQKQLTEGGWRQFNKSEEWKIYLELNRKHARTRRAIAIGMIQARQIEHKN